MPFPIPVIVRPMMNWAVAECPLMAETWMMTPIIITAPPLIIFCTVRMDSLKQQKLFDLQLFFDQACRQTREQR